MADISNNAVEIVLVEDNAGDARLVTEALAEAKVANKLHVIRDGMAAMEYFEKSKTPDGPRRPSLVLLDLNLPKKNGREVLAELKADPQLRSIPVVIMTSSSEEADIAQSYALHANCFITKPVDFEQLLKVVHSVEQFWLRVVALPPEITP